MFRSSNRNRNKDDDSEEPPPVAKESAAKMFGKFVRKTVKNAPEQLLSNDPEALASLPKDKKGIFDKVDWFIVKVIVLEVKRQYDQHSVQ